MSVYRTIGPLVSNREGGRLGVTLFIVTFLVPSFTLGFKIRCNNAISVKRKTNHAMYVSLVLFLRKKIDN